MSVPVVTPATTIVLPPGACQAKVSSSSPLAQSEVKVTITSNVPDSPLTITEHFGSATRIHKSRTDGTGMVVEPITAAKSSAGLRTTLSVVLEKGGVACATSYVAR